MRAIVNLIMSSIAFRAPKIALLSGSLRKGSFNTKLIGAAEQVAAKLGAETSVIDLGAYDLPIYNQDDEADDYPQAAMDLKAVLGEQADGWVVSSPEYNGWISPLLLNAYTWCSRGDPAGGPMYATFAGKSAVVLSSSPGDGRPSYTQSASSTFEQSGRQCVAPVSGDWCRLQGL